MNNISSLEKLCQQSLLSGEIGEAGLPVLVN